MAAALSGATVRQLAHWRNKAASGGAILVPETSEHPILYSFRDVVALRTCVKLRQYSSLQKIRKALSELRFGLGETQHLSSYRLVADGSSIYLVGPEQAVDLVARRGNVVIYQFVEVIAPFYHEGRRIPALFNPREHLVVDPGVRGGEPVIAGTRIPAYDVAALVRDGVEPARVSEFYPGVSAIAAEEAQDFAAYVDSYESPRVRDAA
jgi:uncharacterized protein (DUF433 family)